MPILLSILLLNGKGKPLSLPFRFVSDAPICAWPISAPIHLQMFVVYPRMVLIAIMPIPTSSQMRASQMRMRAN